MSEYVTNSPPPIELSADERLALRLFATYEIRSGTIYRGIEWLNPMATDESAVAAWKWMRMGQDHKDAWLAVATTARRLVKAEDNTNE
ncbi:hypothetical protein A9W98_17965 [Mycobacterium gordonae]|uniref:Uncharacterized protein n=1 Tax=Mycobacterium gordonae TaxID=1778 RepID=A0A1A6BHQ9_MYCGO|nr:hypothetical protein [Mycobacterium gordonae]OBS01870.1 hypothetical protein A9W98_17965 [Mycobacterium gordonae]